MSVADGPFDDKLLPLPPAAQLFGSMRLAQSLLSHRFDPDDPDVLAVMRALDGWSPEEIVQKELEAAAEKTRRIHEWLREVGAE